MSRMFVVSGLHLDRAWPDLAPVFGAALRAWSRELLSEIVSQAQRHEADTLLVLGDLLDRSTVAPDTVEHASKVLGSFAGRVLIAPGRRDWAGDDGPYAQGTFAPNTGVWTSDSYTELPSVPGVLGSAWTSPTADPAPVERDETPGPRRIRVRPEAQPPRMGAGTADLFVTSGETLRVDDAVFVAPHLVRTPGGSGTPDPRALLLDLNDGGVSAQIVSLSDPPGSHTELDVSSLPTTRTLGRALAAAGRGRPPVYLSLVGTLAPGVLLPGSGGPTPDAGVQVDLADLTYADPPRRPGDHSMVAEFLRAVDRSTNDARTRHQITALGLHALSGEPIGPIS